MCRYRGSNNGFKTGRKRSVYEKYRLGKNRFKSANKNRV